MSVFEKIEAQRKGIKYIFRSCTWDEYGRRV